MEPKVKTKTKVKELSVSINKYMMLIIIKETLPSVFKRNMAVTINADVVART